MTRRTSAEVINATLLEVFLAFVFVVLSIAWFEHAAAVIQKTKTDSATAAEAAAVARGDSARKALVMSPYAPPCHRHATPRYFVTLTLLPTGLIDVLVNRSELRHIAGERFAVSVQVLPDSFDDVAQFSKDSICHFLAIVTDATVSKESYKRGLKGVRDIFYTTGELR